MKRIGAVVLSSLLLALPSMAQHGGHGGQHGGRGSNPSGGDANADRQVAQDLQRAMAIQASELQIAQFKSAAKSTEEARKKAQEAQHAAGADDLSAQTKALKDAMTRRPVRTPTS